MKIKTFTKVFDRKDNFIGFLVDKWTDTYLKVLLKPSKNEEIDLKDVVDIEGLEKRLSMMFVILSKPSRKKLMAKLHENFGEFSEEEYPHYLIQYAIRQKVQISNFLQEMSIIHSFIRQQI